MVIFLLQIRVNSCIIHVAFAGVMELVDVVDSKSTASDGVPVRVRPPAPRRQKKPAPFRFRLAAKTARCWLLQYMMDIQFRLEKDMSFTDGLLIHGLFL